MTPSAWKWEGLSEDKKGEGKEAVKNGIPKKKKKKRSVHLWCVEENAWPRQELVPWISIRAGKRHYSFPACASKNGWRSQSPNVLTGCFLVRRELKKKSLEALIENRKLNSFYHYALVLHNSIFIQPRLSEWYNKNQSSLSSAPLQPCSQWAPMKHCHPVFPQTTLAFTSLIPPYFFLFALTAHSSPPPVSSSCLPFHKQE